jgi:hypothetical protein
MGNMSPTVMSNCRIVIVGPKNGDDCLTELRYLPNEAVILGTGMSLEELQKDNTLFYEVYTIV